MFWYSNTKYQIIKNSHPAYLVHNNHDGAWRLGLLLVILSISIIILLSSLLSSSILENVCELWTVDSETTMILYICTQVLPLLVMVVYGCKSAVHLQSQAHPQDHHHMDYLQHHLEMHHYQPNLQSHGYHKRSASPWGFGGFRRRFGGYGSLGYSGYGHHHHHHHHEHCHFYEDGHHHCY